MFLLTLHILLPLALLQLFTEQTISIVSDKSKAFAICPTTLLPLEVHQLRNACPDFRLGGYCQECKLLLGRGGGFRQRM